MALHLGYARVSTGEQNPASQLDALTAAGCDRIYVDHASGAAASRPEWDRLREQWREGDTLVIWRLDRLGRSVKHLVAVMAMLEAEGIGLRSLRESIDTTTPGGRLIFHVFASLAEFERDLIRERTSAGLAAARARGRRGGRPRALSPDQLRAATALLDAGDMTVTDIATSLGVSRSTIYRSLPRPAGTTTPLTAPEEVARFDRQRQAHEARDR